MKVSNNFTVRFSIRERDTRPNWTGPWRLVLGVWLRPTDNGSLIIGAVLQGTPLRVSDTTFLVSTYFKEVNK